MKRAPTIIQARKGIFYFASFQTARDVAEWCGGRVVSYGLGYAVQYHKSGPYFPEYVL